MEQLLVKAALKKWGSLAEEAESDGFSSCVDHLCIVLGSIKNYFLKVFTYFKPSPEN